MQFFLTDWFFYYCRILLTIKHIAIHNSENVWFQINQEFSQYTDWAMNPNDAPTAPDSYFKYYYRELKKICIFWFSRTSGVSFLFQNMPFF